MFGYNNVYVAKTNHLLPLMFPIFYRLRPNAFQKKSNFRGFTWHKGGIFIDPSTAKDQTELVEVLGHEAAHQFNGDATRPQEKFPIISLCLSDIKKKLRTGGGKERKALSWTGDLKSKTSSEIKEFRACKKNVKTLFYSGYFGPLSLLLKCMWLMPMPDPYRWGHFIGFRVFGNN